MANLTKLDFIALDVSGINYRSWVLDAELHLASNKLGETIKENTSASKKDCAKAMILLLHHLHESLKSQYLTVKSPFQLWKSLKDRFDHQKTVILPHARYEWIQLRLQDFKTIAEYNSEMFQIVSKLRLSGEDVTDEQMLEKAFSTFHASNLVLQQQYRERGFKTYSELISCLLVAEENNQLLLNNHHTRPTGSKPLPQNSAALPEANATSSRKGRGRYHGSPWGHSYGHGRGRGCGHGARGRGRGMVMKIIIIYGLIPIFRRTMGTRQRINKIKLQMVIFAIEWDVWTLVPYLSYGTTSSQIIPGFCETKG
ncbi:UNVERIFIED_CONTAM: hypothetical protein Sradi_0234300 [Sesamum radiatum]|uniref:Retrotransposon gag domain-containing protein n=1 Tax=Sesamum radiatum TaxID=300843 RepID=A0AAW2VZT9_SESRA